MPIFLLLNVVYVYEVPGKISYISQRNKDEVILFRSTDDDYCPVEDVEYIQEKAITALTELYGQLDVRLAYLEQDDSK